MLPFQQTQSIRWKEGCARTIKLSSRRRWQFLFGVFLLLALIKPGSAQG